MAIVGLRRTGRRASAPPTPGELAAAQRLRAMASAKRQENNRVRRIQEIAYARMMSARGKTNARASFRSSGGVGAARWTVTPAGNYRRAGASAIRQR